MDALSTNHIDSVVVYQVFIFWHLVPPPVHCCLCCFSVVAFRGGVVIDGISIHGFIFILYYKNHSFIDSTILTKWQRIKFKFVNASLQSKHIYVHWCFT